VLGANVAAGVGHVARLGDHRPVGLALEHETQAAADDGVVIGEDDPQRVGRVARRRVGGDGVGHVLDPR
jgi:hypothetical protein